MTSGQWVLLVAVTAALAFGAYRAAVDGRFSARGRRARGAQATTAAEPRTAPRPGAEIVAAVGAELGERATLLQFSSAFCAPCRATRRTLSEVAEMVDGVAHVEVDAEEHLDATRLLGILRTPTTVVLDAVGREVARAAGAPLREQVIAALGRVV